MTPRPLERAFDLARSGQCMSVAEIRTQLKAEGFDLQALQGKSLFAQLRSLIKEGERMRAETIPGGDLNAGNDK